MTTSSPLERLRIAMVSRTVSLFAHAGDPMEHTLDYAGDRNPDGQGFAAFGKVVKGMDVARAIQALPDEGQYLKGQVLIREISLITKR